MSSSEEEDIRRPGRSTDASRAHSLSDSEYGDTPNAPSGGAESPVGSDADRMNGDHDDDDADLFGDGSEGGLDERPHRTLDDEELDSGDDEDRYDRVGQRMDIDHEEDGAYGETLKVMDISLGRAPEPQSSNGEIYTMAIPNFLSLETEEFRPDTYVAPPFATASTSLCWRYAPDDKSKLQSNARIIRWEDGSMTLQLASNPREQYRIATKLLAPLSKSGDYEAELDTHTYLAAAAETASVFRITSHLTHSLTVLPTDMETDDAVQRLRESLAAAARAGKKADGGVTIIEVKEDPELASKRAELAEKEKLKADRRRQQLAEREQTRTSRRGAYRYPAGGLTVGGLEDEDGMATTRARPAKKPRANRRGEIYTDEEEEYDRRGRTREDRYDEDDGFLVGSDEEPEVVEDDEEEEEELEDEDMDAEGEDDEDVRPEKPTTRKARESASPKRTSAEEAGGAGSPPARKKHRYVVESDEDE
ncbi:hypothetical protein VTN77DRAFT_3060 [Rasamsonia byssochlamydoides]|uniref:uncharacterized protein n=1 Tax=Rasamsonia byssochlamydoides TaxID=89139 RepID=UPI0037436E9A